jgi:hypothetical protein
LGEDISLPAAAATIASQGSEVAISPDGTRLAYVSGAGTGTKLFIRRLDQPKATEVPGTEGARYPSFSPDGQWVAFSTGFNKLHKISVEGGVVVPIGDSACFCGASWGEDGSIVTAAPFNGLERLSAGGGPPQTILKGLRRGLLL